MSQSVPATAPLISELADNPDMIELVDMFVRELPDRAQALEGARFEEDFSNLARLAHQLKGSAGSYGFPAIAEKAAQLEQAAAHHQDLDQLHRKVAELVQLCRTARATADST